MTLSRARVVASLALIIVIGIITGTGAFTTATADRSATVNVAGDGSALLALAPANTENGDKYAQVSGGTLELTFDSVNLNALMEINNVFTITNNGGQDVEVWIEPNMTDAGGDELIGFYTGAVDGPNSGELIGSKATAETLKTESSTTISIEIDTRGAGLSTDTQITDEITIHANTTTTS